MAASAGWHARVLLAVVCLAVVTAGANIPPVVDAGPDNSEFTAFQDFTLVGRSSDVDGYITSTSWTPVELPQGYALTQGSTSAKDVLRVVAPLPGSYIFRYSVIDNEGTSSWTDVHAVVRSPSGTPPAIKMPQNEIVTLSSDRTNLKLEASCTDPDPTGFITRYKWSLVAGSASGVSFSGTDTNVLLLNILNVGKYKFRLDCTDKSTAFSSGFVTIRVVDSNAHPTIDIPSFVEVALPFISYGTVAAHQSDVEGLVENWDWAQTAGPSKAVLAATVSPSLKICGSPVEGDYKFLARALDSLGSIAEKEVSVKISSSLFARVLGIIISVLLFLLLIIDITGFGLSAVGIIVLGALHYSQLLHLLLFTGVNFPASFHGFLAPLRWTLLRLPPPTIHATDAMSCETTADERDYFFGAILYSLIIGAIVALVHGALYVLRKKNTRIQMYGFPQVELYLVTIVVPGLLANSAVVMRHGAGYLFFGVVIFISCIAVIAFFGFKLVVSRPKFLGSGALSGITVDQGEKLTSSFSGSSPDHRQGMMLRIARQLLFSSDAHGQWQDEPVARQLGPIYTLFRPQFASHLWLVTQLARFAACCFVIAVFRSPVVQFVLLIILAVLHTVHAVLTSPYLQKFNNTFAAGVLVSELCTLSIAAGLRESAIIGGLLAFVNFTVLLLKTVHELVLVFMGISGRGGGLGAGGLLEVEKSQAKLVGVIRLPRIGRTLNLFSISHNSSVDGAFEERFSFFSEAISRGWGTDVDARTADVFLFFDNSRHNLKSLLEDVPAEAERKLAEVGVEFYEDGLTALRESTPPEQGFPAFVVSDYFIRIAGNLDGSRNMWRKRPCVLACIDYEGAPSGRSFTGVRVAASIDRQLRATGMGVNFSRVFDFFLVKDPVLTKHTIAAIVEPSDITLPAFLRQVTYADDPAACATLLRGILCQVLVALHSSNMSNLGYSVNDWLESIHLILCHPGFRHEVAKRSSPGSLKAPKVASASEKKLLHYQFADQQLFVDLTKTPLVKICSLTHPSGRVLNGQGQSGQQVLHTKEESTPAADLQRFALSFYSVLKAAERSLGVLDPQLHDLLQQVFPSRHLDDMVVDSGNGMLAIDSATTSCPSPLSLLSHPFFSPLRQAPPASTYGNTIFAIDKPTNQPLPVRPGTTTARQSFSISQSVRLYPSDSPQHVV